MSFQENTISHLVLAVKSTGGRKKTEGERERENSGRWRKKATAKEIPFDLDINLM